jgi:hypothetical protein
VTAGDVLGNRATSLQAPHSDKVQGSASRKSEKDVPCGTRPGTSLVQSCFLIEAQVQRVSYCYEYGGKGGAPVFIRLRLMGYE